MAPRGRVRFLRVGQMDADVADAEDERRDQHRVRSSGLEFPANETASKTEATASGDQEKRQKKWHPQWDSNPCYQDENLMS